MKIKIIAVGSLKEHYLKDAFAEYQKRLSAYAVTEVAEIAECRLPEKPSEKEIASALEKEGAEILKKIPPRALVAALCIEGKLYSSEELAALLKKSEEQGTFCLIIGGSFGLSPAVKARADVQLSFSRMTFPHQLMRVILAEQLYRAGNINAGGKYHK